MGGGYTNVIPIPVDDPNIKAIAGALFKPEGAGPFPGVVFMSGCAGLEAPSRTWRCKRAVIDHLLACKGVAVLMVDPVHAAQRTGRHLRQSERRHLPQICDPRRQRRGFGGTLKVLKATPGVDPNRIFLQGYSWGAISSLFAMDPNTPSVHDAKIAGLVAYYPYCYDKVEFSTPTLVLIGDKDDWTPAKPYARQPRASRIWKSLFFRSATHAFQCAISRSRWTTSDITSSMTKRRRAGGAEERPTPSWVRT